MGNMASFVFGTNRQQLTLPSDGRSDDRGRRGRKMTSKARSFMARREDGCVEKNMAERKPNLWYLYIYICICMYIYIYIYACMAFIHVYIYVFWQVDWGMCMNMRSSIMGWRFHILRHQNCSSLIFVLCMEHDNSFWVT